jgi:hypothetical protein|tara:strand:+ start:270 stop:908 length:639 start_codon:yes stop_codon:yes gene_type:complete
MLNTKDNKAISTISKERKGLFANSTKIQTEFKSGVTGLLGSHKKIIAHNESLGKDGGFKAASTVIGDRPQDLKKTMKQNPIADEEAVKHFVAHAMILRDAKAALVMGDYPKAKNKSEVAKQLERAKSTAKQWWSDTICGNKKKQVARNGASANPQSAGVEKVEVEKDLNEVADIQAQNYINALTALLPSMSDAIAVSWVKMIADVKALHAID